MPKKEPAQIVNPVTSSMTDLRPITNGVFNADNAEGNSFGNVSMLKSVTNFLGSNYGFKKAIPSADSQSFPDTAPSKSSTLKMIGLGNFQNMKRIFPASDTSSMTVLISEETTALSPS